MAHLMASGKPCGLPHGHNGQHMSAESIAQKRERMRERMSERRANDPEFGAREREYARQWAADNPDDKRDRDRAYYEQNRLSMLEHNRQWREAHPNHNRDYRRDNPEIVRASNSRRRQRLSVAMDAFDRELSVAYRKAIANDLCFYCGNDGEHDDHYIPLAKDGTDHWHNLVRACARCNLKKCAMMPDEFCALMAA